MAQKRRFRRLLIIAASILLIIGLAAVLFFSRAPLLIVTDAEFIAIYGARRSRLKEAETSLRLFRRVKTVTLAEGAGPDVVAFAVDAAAEKPFGVVFPYRYDEGARLYAAQEPGIPVAVLIGTAENKASHEGFLYIGSDKGSDFYRAGLCAAVFARHDNGKVLLFEGNATFFEDRTAFIQGLVQGGYDEAPIFINSADAFEPMAGFSCAVIVGAAIPFLGKNPALPMIVFSWIDPAITSQAVKIVFDDSPWALAPALVEAFSMNLPPEVLPSAITALKARIENDEVRKELQKIIRNNERYE